MMLAVLINGPALRFFHCLISKSKELQDMDYGRKDYESYRDRYDREDWDVRHRNDVDQARRRNFEDAKHTYGRDFPDRASAYSPTNFARGDDTNYAAEYPDRWSSWEASANRENLSGQGARRSHLRCRDIMTRQVTTVTKNTPIGEIARLMRDEDVGAIPVLDENGKLAGIVTDRDLIVEGLTKKEDDSVILAQDCMSTDLFTANQNDRLVDVIKDMGDHQVRRVPVVDNRDRLVGIIAMADVATQTNKDRELEEALKDISMPSSWFGRMAYYLGF
jgi:CBS domain-containing protein